MTGAAGKEMQSQHTACPGIEQYLNGYKCVNTFHWCLIFRATLWTKQRKLIEVIQVINVNNFNHIKKCNQQEVECRRKEREKTRME